MGWYVGGLMSWEVGGWVVRGVSGLMDRRIGGEGGGGYLRVDWGAHPTRGGV